MRRGGVYHMSGDFDDGLIRFKYTFGNVNGILVQKLTTDVGIVSSSWSGRFLNCGPESKTRVFPPSSKMKTTDFFRKGNRVK